MNAYLDSGYAAQAKRAFHGSFVSGEVFFLSEGIVKYYCSGSVAVKFLSLCGSRLLRSWGNGGN